MAKIIDNDERSVHMDQYGESIWLTIGVESFHGKARGKNRNTWLDAKQARKLAIALFLQADKLDERLILSKQASA
jgi:hypothetical protein